MDETPLRRRNQEKLLPPWISVVETLLCYGAALILETCGICVSNVHMNTSTCVRLHEFLYMYVYVHRFVYSNRMLRLSIELTEENSNERRIFYIYKII